LLHAPGEREDAPHVDRGHPGHPLRLPAVHAHTGPGRPHADDHARHRGGAGHALTIPTRASGSLGVILALTSLLAACGSPALPVLGTVPAFSLTERGGAPLTQNDLRGKVWVADFIFTRCPDVCPLLTSRMRDLQKTLDEARADVTLVSFTVDPGHDTPQVLQAYATAHGAGPGWSFATGDRNVVSGLLRDG